MIIILKSKIKEKRIFISNRSQYLLLLNKFIFFKQYKKKQFKLNFIDFTSLFLLKYFLTEYGKIVPYLNLNISFKYYKQISKSIKKARYVKLLPYFLN